MKKSKSWDDYEKELLAKGKITEDEIKTEKVKMDNSGPKRRSEKRKRPPIKTVF